MDYETPLPLTPEQSAAIAATHGSVYFQDPATNRCFVLVEQPVNDRLNVDELRAMLDEGIAQSDRGESRPWDPEEMKEEIRQRHTNRSSN